MVGGGGGSVFDNNDNDEGHCDSNCDSAAQAKKMGQENTTNTVVKQAKDE